MTRKTRQNLLQNAREDLWHYSLNLLSQNDHIIYLRRTRHCFCTVQVFNYLEAIAMWHNILQSRKSKLIATESLAITFRKHLNFHSQNFCSQ